MALGRRGIFFTLTVLILLSVVFVLSYGKARYSSVERSQIIEARILTMNDFMDSFEEDAERAIYISGFRTLIALEDFVAFRAEFLNDTNWYLKQIFYNGSIPDEEYGFDIMNGSTFYDYVQKVDYIADQVNLEFDASVVGIRSEMISPWIMRISVDMLVNLTDQDGLARWSYNETISGEIPIDDLRDPLYSVSTLGKMPITVRRSPFIDFVNDTFDMNDTMNLQIHLNESYYLNNSMGPTFLMRFENNLTSHPMGIESLVNLQVLADQGVVIADNEKSVVDWVYFSEDQVQESFCNIQNMEFAPEFWFVLDKNHSEVYDVNVTLEHDDC